MAEEGLGSLDGGLQDPEMEETKPPSAPEFAPIQPQPCNQATMVCLRGPCVHLWRLVLRFEESVKDTGVMRERAWTCLASSKEFDLNERLIYYCDRWWPRSPLYDDDEDETLLVDPKMFAEIEEQQRLRPELHQQWEAALKEMGYDFSWRDFDPETFNTDDDPHQRKFSAPGGLEAAREAKEQEGLPPAVSIPEDDPPPVKTPEEEEAEAEAEYIHQMLKKRQQEND